jgi:aspartate/methionine/tyrosine aminotransferase
MTRYIFGGYECKPENIVCGPGVTALLHHLSLLLFESGDSILIPAPYYPAFVKDFSNLGTVVTHDVIHLPISDDDTSWLNKCWTNESLDDAYRKAIDSGHLPKAVLLTNPNNPTGVVSSKEDLLSLIEWCKSKQIHLIADEIYALSVFEEDQKFVSVVELLENNLGDHVHVLWGLSKDFGASGLRLGVIYSQNQTLLRAMGYITDAYQVSTLVQVQAATFLSDDSFLERYISENRKRLRASYEILKKGLEEVADIQLVAPSGAGVFAFADCRLLLAEKSFVAERELTNWFIEHGVVLTPGEACHCPVPGFFRICFAWVEPDALREAVKRIALVAERARTEKVQRQARGSIKKTAGGGDEFPQPTKRPKSSK